MKNITTRVAFITAIVIAITLLNRDASNGSIVAPNGWRCVKSTNDAAMVRAISASKATSTLAYMPIGKTWEWQGACDAMALLGNQIEEREKKDPDQVDEVPVQAHEFGRDVIL